MPTGRETPAPSGECEQVPTEDLGGGVEILAEGPRIMGEGRGKAETEKGHSEGRQAHSQLSPMRAGD